MKLREVVSKAAQELKNSGIESYRLDAEVLMEKILSYDRIFLISHPEQEVPDVAAARYFGCAEERAKGRPLAYIIGEKEFMGLPFEVSESVLIPRPDTETAAEAALRVLGAAGAEDFGADLENYCRDFEPASEIIKEDSRDCPGDAMRKSDREEANKKRKAKPRVLDLCTGSGALAVAIAHYAPFAEVAASDISKEALEIAKKNAESNGVKVSFFKGDLFEPLKEEQKFDLIISNPPYIPSEDIKTLEKNVKDYEPSLALDGGENGLDFYEKIVPEAAEFLVSGGYLMLEIGFDQAEALRKITETCGRYKNFNVLKDLAGLDRVVVMQLV